jgi:hypothetical protein
VLVALLSGLPQTRAQTPAGQAAGVDFALIEDIVVGSHILAEFGVLDGFGHVSARDPKNPNHFLMSRSLAPALVSAEDIMEFDLDGNAVDAGGRSVFIERFIHSEIYKARPDVMSVVHAHSSRRHSIRGEPGAVTADVSQHSLPCGRRSGLGYPKGFWRNRYAGARSLARQVVGGDAQ